MLVLLVAVGLAANGCGGGGSATDDPKESLLTNGKVVTGKVKNDCDNSFVLDAVGELCELFQTFSSDPNTAACVTQDSSCNSYATQIYAGSNLGSSQKQASPGWNGRGGSGDLMADAAVCTLRQLSPKLDGPVNSQASLNIGIGDVVVKQQVGYLDFDRINRRFKGYRKLSVELPVIGKFDAITQNIVLQRVHYGTGQLYKSTPMAGDYPILSGYGLNLDTEEKKKSIDINPGSFNVDTPIGTFQVSPHFKYESNTVVADLPYVTNHTYIPLDDDTFDVPPSPAAIRLTDIYGIIPGININTTPMPSLGNYKNLRTGWISQIGLGSRGSIGDKLWAPPLTGFFYRPDYDPGGVFKFESYESRSNDENKPSVYAEASASIKYPDNPADMLPEWVDGLPGLDWDAYIKVTPTIKAGAAGQFGISMLEGTDNRRSNEFDVRPESRTSALGIYSGVETNASFEVLAELRLYVSAVFDFFFGSKRIDLIDIHPKFPIPIAGGTPSSSKVELATAYSSTDNIPDFPETLDYLKTFKGTKLPEEFINLCYAKEAEVPAEDPPCTKEGEKDQPPCKPEKGDVTDLFEYLPCNICLATNAVIDSKTGAVKEPEHREIISPVVPVPPTDSTTPAVWKCDSASKSGCMDLCKLNKETGAFTVVKNPSEIADSMPVTDPDYSELYPFYNSCKVSCDGGPVQIGDYTYCKGLDPTPPEIFGLMVPGGSSSSSSPSPVPVASNIAAPFSEPMDPESINTNTFTVSDADGNSVSGTVRYDGATYTATFSPSSPFNYSSIYTATITTGARDLAGNPLQDAFSWTFTTEAAPATAFATSATGNGNLSSWTAAGGKAGLEAGDAICQSLASEAGLSGTFVAWLSDSSNDAYCRVHNLTGKKSDNCGQASLPDTAGPWVRTGDGFPFSADISQLVNDGTVYAPVKYDESGNAFIAGEKYMTGTNADGTYDASGNTTCYDWTSNTSNLMVHAVGGWTDGTTYSWTHNYSTGCNSSSWRLLCLETGEGLPLPDFATFGKKVFVTSSSGTGDLSTWPGAGVNRGVAAGDAICQSLAVEAGLSNASNFKAWLSSYTSSSDYVHAKDRLTSDGPWVRPDGVLVANNKADLIDGSLFTAISQTETGDYLSTTTWTGTYSNGTLESTISNCEGWTTAAPLRGEGSLGESSLSDGNWTKTGYNPCSTLRHLYCFED